MKEKLYFYSLFLFSNRKIFLRKKEYWNISSWNIMKNKITCILRSVRFKEKWNLAKERIETARSQLFEFISLIFGRNRERKSTQYLVGPSLTSFRWPFAEMRRASGRKEGKRGRQTKGEGKGKEVVAPQIEILLARGIIYREHGPLSRGRESLRTNVCHVTSYTLCHAKFRTATAILPAPRLNYPTISPFLSLS